MCQESRNGFPIGLPKPVGGVFDVTQVLGNYLTFLEPFCDANWTSHVASHILGTVAVANHLHAFDVHGQGTANGVGNHRVPLCARWISKLKTCYNCPMQQYDV